MARFADREEAGRILGARLAAEPERDDRLVLGLPRGGVPVAAAVAAVLEAPLDALVVRKLGVPPAGELAFGALATGGIRVVSPATIAAARLDDETVQAIAAHEAAELQLREERLRAGRPPPRLAGRPVILVDDGLATGATMWAAVAAARRAGAHHVTVAVPVGTAEACATLATAADAVVCCMTPEPFRAVGRWYRDFRAVDDATVRRLLGASPEG